MGWKTKGDNLMIITIIDELLCTMSAKSILERKLIYTRLSLGRKTFKMEKPLQRQLITIVTTFGQANKIIIWKTSCCIPLLLVNSTRKDNHRW